MTLADLIDDFREESHDLGTPPFWSFERLAKIASEGQREACRRGDLLIDSTGPMCSVSVTAGEPIVTLDPRALEVKRIRLASRGFQLLPVTTGCMDEYASTWEQDSGEPTNYVTDYQTGAIRLYPIQAADDELLLTVRRLPLADLVDDADEPEIRLEAQPALVQWMLYRAYSKQDADTFDPHKAARSLAEFEREFGRKTSARNEQWMRSANVVGADPIA